MLSKSGADLIFEAKDELYRQWTILLDGRIYIGTLEIISQHHASFSELINTITPSVKADYVEKIIHTRQTEIESFKEQASQMRAFLSLCQDLRKILPVFRWYLLYILRIFYDSKFETQF